jgi:AraC-like DNA-binding protein
MQFSFHRVPPPLSDSVKTIWCARGTKEEFAAPAPIVPDGCIEIVLNLGDRFIDAASGELQPRDLLAGQMTRPVTALPTGTVDLIGVRFKTGRGAAALRTPMGDLQDRLIAASSVVQGIEQIVDDLRSLAPDARIGHLSLALADRFRVSDAVPISAIDHALAIIKTSSGRVPIATVAKRVGITRRHLERLFREHVGLSAKSLGRIVRVHRLLELLQQASPLSGAEIAVACGYSDQAHMIRECQELAGQTPQRLKTTSRSLASMMRLPT